MSRFVLTGFGDEIADSLDTQMDVMCGLGIRHIELRGIDGKNVSLLSAEEAKEAKLRMDDRGFRASAIGSPIGKYDIISPFEPHLDLFEHVLDLADVFETQNIRIFSFFMPEGDDPDGYRDEVIKRLGIMAERAKVRGKQLLHENERFIYGDTPSRCAGLLEALSSDNFNMLFDPGNFTHCGVENNLEAYNLLKSRIKYLHVKDSLSQTSSRRVLDMGFQNVEGDEQRPAGQGDSNVIGVLRALWNDGYEGFLSIEPHLMGGSFVAGDNAQKFRIAAKALQLVVEEIGATWE